MQIPAGDSEDRRCLPSRSMDHVGDTLVESQSRAVGDSDGGDTRVLDRILDNAAASRATTRGHAAEMPLHASVAAAHRGSSAVDEPLLVINEVAVDCLIRCMLNRREVLAPLPRYTAAVDCAAAAEYAAGAAPCAAAPTTAASATAAPTAAPTATTGDNTAAAAATAAIEPGSELYDDRLARARAATLLGERRPKSAPANSASCLSRAPCNATAPAGWWKEQHL